MKSVRMLLIALFVLALLPCAAQGEDAVTSATLGVLSMPAPAEHPASGVLVAYFSTDDTLRAAAAIAADALGADLFEIVPAVPYTGADLNYSDSSSRATREQRDDAARPEIAALPDDLTQYDTLLLGYPIWWGQAPKILCTFLESVDLSGKTVIPFCTSASSGAGSSAKNLQKLTGDAVTWTDAKRIDNDSDADSIRDWVLSLGLTKEESVMQLKIGDTQVSVIWEDNASVAALKELARGGLTVQMSMYGGFEQVGSLGTSLPREDAEATTRSGDIVLYSGNQIVVFYGSNSWAYTRLGHIADRDEAAMRALLGNGDMTLTLSAE